MRYQVYHPPRRVNRTGHLSKITTIFQKPAAAATNEGKHQTVQFQPFTGLLFILHRPLMLLLWIRVAETAVTTHTVTTASSEVIPSNVGSSIVSSTESRKTDRELRWARCECIPSIPMSVSETERPPKRQGGERERDGQPEGCLLLMGAELVFCPFCRYCACGFLLQNADCFLVLVFG